MVSINSVPWIPKCPSTQPQSIIKFLSPTKASPKITPLLYLVPRLPILKTDSPFLFALSPHLTHLVPTPTPMPANRCTPTPANANTNECEHHTKANPNINTCEQCSHCLVHIYSTKLNTISRSTKIKDYVTPYSMARTVVLTSY